MLTRLFVVVWIAGLASSSLHAAEGCDPAFTHSYHECLRIVDSLRPDKGGQMRVYASDGSEFTAGQALWMKSQLRQVDRACAQGNQEAASRLLAGVQELLKAHARAG